MAANPVNENQNRQPNTVAPSPLAGNFLALLAKYVLTPFVLAVSFSYGLSFGTFSSTDHWSLTILRLHFIRFICHLLSEGHRLVPIEVMK